MTIPKHAGLSRLAEAASPIEYYPVRRRSQKRRLTPNWDAIRWLEDETLTEAEISQTFPLGPPGTEQAELLGLVSLGRYSAKRTGHFPRRMFDVFALGVSSTHGVMRTPCEACDNYAYSWECDQHTELPWDPEKRRFVRPGAGPTAYVSPEPPAPRGNSVLAAMYEQMNAYMAQVQPVERRSSVQSAPESHCNCSTCVARFGRRPRPGREISLTPHERAELERQAAEEWNRQRRARDEMTRYRWVDPVDQNRNRPGYHYVAATDRWERDTDDAIGDFRAGRVDHATDAMMFGIPIADLLQYNRVPPELGPTREDFLGALPDISIQLSGYFEPGPHTVEITGDTTQAPSSTIRIEVEPNGQSTS